jgi:hypothetical protein
MMRDRDKSAKSIDKIQTERRRNVERALARVCEMARRGVIPLAVLQVLIDEYDPMISVDRTVTPEYPNWAEEKLYPEMEKTGPTAFDASKLEHWLHPGQVDGVVEGNNIHQLLKRENLIEGCLGLADLLAIQKRGLTFFRKYFAGKAIFGWKSVVRSRDGRLLVPYLLEDGGGAVVSWRWLDYYWSSRRPALRFAST